MAGMYGQSISPGGPRFAKKALGSDHEREQLRVVANRLIESLNIFGPMRVKSQENYEFVEADGGQWSAQLKAWLDKKGVTPIEINIILPRILAVIGQWIETKGRIVAIPPKAHAVTDAEVGTRLLEWQDEVNRMVTGRPTSQEIWKAFIDAMISELAGWVKIFQDDVYDPMGMQVVKHVSPFHMLWDAKVSIDRLPTQGEWVMESAFMPVEQIEASWQRKADDIRRIAGNYVNRSWWQSITDRWASIGGAGEEMRDEFVHQKENSFRVVQMEERRWEEVGFIIYDGKFERVTKEEGRAILEQFPDAVDYVERRVPVIWTTITLGDWLVLDEYQNAVQNGIFSYIPLSGLNFSGKNFSSLVSQLKGLQKEKNEARTSFLSILRSNAFGGWIYKANDLSEEMKTRLEEFGAWAGFNLELQPSATQYPQRISQQAISQGDILRDQMTMSDVDNVTAISAGALGLQEEGTESGVHHRQRLLQAAKGQRLMFENASNCELNVARYLLALMNVHLQPERAVEICGEESNVEELIQNGDFRLDEWQVKIVQGDQSETQRAMKLAEIQTVVQTLAATSTPEYYQQLSPMLIKMMIKSLNWTDAQPLVDKIEELEQGQVPLAFQAKILQALQGVDESYAAGLPEETRQLEAGFQQQEFA